MKIFPAIVMGLSLALIVPGKAQVSAPVMPNLTFPPAATPASSAPAATSAASPATTATTLAAKAIFSDPAASFSAGVTAYEKNDFAKAREYFSAAEAKSVSASLEYNFGNACSQANDNPAAILHYLRAISLNPRDPDARQNLALARAALRLPVPEPGRLESFSAMLAGNTWAWLVTLAGWATVYLAVLPRLYRWRGATPWLLCIVMGLLAVAAGSGYWGAHGHARDGVVLHSDAPIKLSPTANSPAIGVLQGGEVAETLEEHGGFFKVLAADGRMGWMDGADYSPVWQ